MVNCNFYGTSLPPCMKPECSMVFVVITYLSEHRFPRVILYCCHIPMCNRKEKISNYYKAYSSKLILKNKPKLKGEKHETE